jgi:hypothetical protein
MAEKYYSVARPREELYDLQADPLEQENLAGEAKYEELLCDLSAEVDEWMDETDDLLLRGRWPASEAHAENMAQRLHEERFEEWMRMTLRDWPEMLWFLEESEE